MDDRWILHFKLKDLYTIALRLCQYNDRDGIQWDRTRQSTLMSGFSSFLRSLLSLPIFHETPDENSSLHYEDAEYNFHKTYIERMVTNISKLFVYNNLPQSDFYIYPIDTCRAVQLQMDVDKITSSLIEYNEFVNSTHVKNTAFERPTTARRRTQRAGNSKEIPSPDEECSEKKSTTKKERSGLFDLGLGISTLSDIVDFDDLAELDEQLGLIDLITGMF